MSHIRVAQRYQVLLNQGHQAPLKQLGLLWIMRFSIDAKTFSVTRLMTARAAVQVDHMMRVGAKVGPDVRSVNVTRRLWPRRPGPLMTVAMLGLWCGWSPSRHRVGWFDDNRKAGLIGSVAALPIISDAFQYVRRTHRPNNLPEGLGHAWLNKSGQVVDQGVKVPKNDHYR